MNARTVRLRFIVSHNAACLDAMRAAEEAGDEDLVQAFRRLGEESSRLLGVGRKEEERVS